MSIEPARLPDDWYSVIVIVGPEDEPTSKRYRNVQSFDFQYSRDGYIGYHSLYSLPGLRLNMRDGSTLTLPHVVRADWDNPIRRWFQNEVEKALARIRELERSEPKVVQNYTTTDRDWRPALALVCGVIGVLFGIIAFIAAVLT